MFLDLVSLKNKNADNRYGRKTKEKTMLRVLRSRRFPHSLLDLRNNARLADKCGRSPVCVSALSLLPCVSETRTVGR